MSKRNSPKQFNSLVDLDNLEAKVIDKRNHKRSDNKKNRRDRHYKKQFIKNLLDRTATDNDFHNPTNEEVE